MVALSEPEGTSPFQWSHLFVVACSDAMTASPPAKANNPGRR